MDTFENKKEYRVEKADESQNEATPRELWEELGSYSTLHGFRFTFSGFSKVRRALWIILLLGSGALVVNQIYKNLLKVAAFEVVLKYRTENKGSLDFPAVSICNNNLFRRSRINGTFAQRYLDLLDPLKKSELPELEKGMNFSMDTESAALQYGHNLTDMMHGGKCQWPGKTCHEQNFTTFLEMKYGLCYSFNSGKNGKDIVKSVSTKENGGFSVILDTQPEEYYGPYSYEGTGFRVVIHDQNGYHAMEEQSLQISPGFSVDMRILRNERHSLEPPYETRCKKEDGYTQTYCEDECGSNEVLSWCKCRVMGSVGKKSENAPWCSPWQIQNCVTHVFSTLAQTNLAKCSCPPECRSVTFDVTTSFMLFPSDTYWETKFKGMIDNLTEKQLTGFKNHFRKCFVKLNVFYGKLINHITSEAPAYALTDLANDLGGSMGLFVGCSVLTVFEFIDVFITMCISHWRIKRRDDHGVSE